MSPLRPIVAVPARNEVERLPGCLRALAAQRDCDDQEILVLVNNSTDGSADAARQVAAGARVRILVAEVTFPPDEANAGAARRLAMELAAARQHEAGVLLTTDADGEVAPNWLATNLAALAAGADAVAGRAALYPADAAAIPASLADDDAAECAYATLLDRMAARLDPDPADPWPRHDEHSGASIAVTLGAYHRAGGIPLVAVAEDRAFFAALRRADARIRHAPEVRAFVSGRVEGRARGGMADTIRRRLLSPDLFLDDRLEPAEAAWRRFALRAQVRRARAGAAESGLAAALRLDPDALAAMLAAATFGAAWEAIEAASPALRRRLVPAVAVEAETSRARALLAGLSASGSRRPAYASTSSR